MEEIEELLNEFVNDIKDYLQKEKIIKAKLINISDKIHYIDCLVKLLNENYLYRSWDRFLKLNISNKDLDYILDHIIPYIIVWNITIIKRTLTRLLNYRSRKSSFNYNKRLNNNKILKIFEVLYG